MKSKNALIGVVLIVLIVSVSLGAVLLLGDGIPPPTPTDTTSTPGFNLRPVITIQNPDEGATLSDTVSINVTIEDEDELTADIYIDGTLMATANTYDWDTTTLPDGPHTIRIRAIDSEGRFAINSIQVYIDNYEDNEYVFTGEFLIMCYNIKESGLNDHWKTVVKNQNPDLLVLVETGFMDDDANQSLNAALSDFNAYFADEAPYMGYTCQNVEYSTTGEAILSRFPVLDVNQIGIVKLDDGSDYDVTHDFLEAVIDVNGTSVHVISGHLKASDGENNEWRREREQEGINNYMDSLGDVPILYMSDQNSFSPVDVGPLAGEGMELGYGPMTMMLDPDDPTYGEFASTVHNFTDVFRTLNPSDPGFSYGHRDTAVSYRIDYIIVNDFFIDMLVNSTVVSQAPAYDASDHYPVTAFLDWLGGT